MADASQQKAVCPHGAETREEGQPRLRVNDQVLGAVGVPVRRPQVGLGLGPILALNLFCVLDKNELNDSYCWSFQEI